MNTHERCSQIPKSVCHQNQEVSSFQELNPLQAANSSVNILSPSHLLKFYSIIAIMSLPGKEMGFNFYSKSKKLLRILRLCFTIK